MCSKSFEPGTLADKIVGVFIFQQKHIFYCDDVAIPNSFEIGAFILLIHPPYKAVMDVKRLPQKMHMPPSECAALTAPYWPQNGND